MQDFVHLHVHTQYSLLDGQASVSRLVDKAVEIQERELKNVRRNWQHYFKLNANYNYGSSDIYNQNYQDNSNQIWTTTTTGREQSW